MQRRFFLKGAALLGCSAAAHPWLSTVTLAQGERALGEQRLVVIILRGAMDGLDAVQPLADPLFADYRPTLAGGSQATDLDGYFALHPDLGGLTELWAKGELGFAHAVSTPYRDKRSHFDGQDLLEAGTGMDVPLGAQREGWLNRMLQAVPGITAETAYAVGREAQPMLEGLAQVRNWTPDVKLQLSAQSRLLLEHIYHEDALFRDTAQEAIDLAAAGDAARMAAGGIEAGGIEAGGIEMGGMEMGGMETGGMAPDPAARKMGDIDTLVDFAAGRLAEATRIAAFSLSGWDTHRTQGKVIGQSFRRLERMILRLRDQLGPVWRQTTVLAMTEFGRTVRENGSHGTDHGTGGVMVMAGGAVRGGRVLGRWPGLAEADLYAGRDLMPTGDVRAYAAWAMRGLYGFDRSVLERAVFPGLDMGDDPGLIL